MPIIAIQQLPQQNVLHFFREHWGTTEMVISSGIYDCSQLEGFAYVNDQQEMIGLVTYIIRSKTLKLFL